MAFAITPMTNSERSGENTVGIGQGTVSAAGVLLQGFYMSYVDTDRDLNGLVAATLTAQIVNSNGAASVRYKFRCEMRDDDGHLTPDNRILTVVLANFVPQG